MSDGKEATARFKGISDNKSRYTIQSCDEYHDEIVTALVSIYDQLSLKPYNIGKDLINTLSNYFKLQQCDTESMKWSTV